MIRIRSLSLSVAFALATLAGTSYAATESTNTDMHPKTDQSGGKTAGEGSSVNTPGSSRDNDSSNAGVHDGASGGSNSTGEATGSGAGASGGTAEDQDSN
ncbi:MULTISPECIES: hypothetical protein [Pseudomonas]|uniref:hypothetical protein n=1 Tax=Pseudomonas TaxID=286 RepID=UPI00040F8C66|nr:MULTISPECIES: hypothetical protein [Pseudomonas]MBK4988067.1 hypothetical protein [Pseudomonas sp. S36]MBK5010259.1 hypothetical protein [Pseudomonas sp. S60]